LAADACGIERVELATLTPHSFQELAQKTRAASIENPIDLRGDATAADFKEAFAVCERDKNVDGILAIVTPQAMTELEAIAWEAVSAKKWGKKPIYVNFIGGELTQKAEEVCRGNGIATFSYPERAVRAFRYQASFESQKNHPVKALAKNPRHQAAKSIINFATAHFSNDRLSSLLGIYDVPMAKTKLVKSEHGVEEALKEIKLPVVMKISSPDILHKTDVGGVMLGIESEKEAKSAFRNIIANVQKEAPKARIEGVTVMQTAKEGLEVILGAKRDPIFGPVLMFGFGGIYVELISDFVTVVGPFDRAKLERAIEKTAVSKILKGYRGKEGYSKEKLIRAMTGIASLITEHPEIAQVEINPLVMEEKGEILGLDAKISLAEKIRK
jgi:acyl-CoA synthetase (NDP forming)